MEFRVLGPLEVQEGDRIVDVRGRQRMLLAVLLASPNEIVSSERLIDSLWGEAPPTTAQTALQVHVSQLRKLLGADRIETKTPGYRIVADVTELDSLRFESLLDQGRIDEALELRRGRAFAEFENEAWAAAEAERLEELRVGGEELQIEQELTDGGDARLLARLEALTRAYPFRERLRAQLMRGLYTVGRQADALALYQETRTLLVEELGIEPGPELQALHKQILNHDPALAPPADVHEAAPTTGRDERKVVTILFCDLVGFTTRAEQRDPEDVDTFLRRHHIRLRALLERHGGTVETFVGDAVMAIFGAPVAHEDDAERAVRAALAICDWIAEAEPDLEVRLGIATGTTLVRLSAAPQEGQAMVVGDVVNTAARLQQAAPRGAVLVGEAAYHATRSTFVYERLDPIVVKGKADPVPVWVAKGLRDVAGDTERPTTPFVGRETELSLLEQTFVRTLQERSPQLVTIVGEPGIGKTRLLAELRRAVEQRDERPLVHHGRCLAYGDGITFWALGQILKEHAGILDTDAPGTAAAKLDAAVSALVGNTEHAWIAARLAPLVGAGGDAADREQSFAAWATFFEQLAGRQPLVLLIEDLHWADSALLDFLDHLVEWATDVPLLVLTTARPELYERRPEWAAGKRNTATIALSPLTGHETGELIDALLDSALDSEMRELLQHRSGGNPLYAEELALLLGGRRPNGEVVIPDTVQSVIAARLDTLPPERKRLIHAAAVVGKVFWAGAIAAITGTEKEAVLSSLRELGRKELVRRSRHSTIDDDVEYLFWHALVRDVAYEQIPRAERVRDHVAAAQWIERVAAERADDHAEFLAHHYATALELQRAIAPTDVHDVETAAVRWTAAAADRALRLDLGAAVRHYERALALVSAESVEGARILPKLASALARTGSLPRADAALSDAIRAAHALGDAELEQAATVERASWRLWSDPWSIEDARGVAEHAIPFFERAEAWSELAKAWHLRADAEPQWAAGVAALERALGYARRAGDTRAEADALWWLTVSLYFGPTPVQEAIGCCEEILRVPGLERLTRAGTLGILGGLIAMHGRFDEARACFDESLEILGDLGARLRIASRRTISGAIELLADDAQAAERELRWGFERLREMGEHQDLPGIAGQLAEALYRQGRYAEAAPYAELNEAEDQPRLRWRGPAAKLLARRGELEQAARLGQDAVARAAAIDNLNAHGNALVNLAEVLQLAGRTNESATLLRDAVSVFEQKDNTVEVARVRGLLQSQTVAAL